MSPPCPQRSARRGDRGAATAELAAALPVLMVLLLAALTGVGGVVTKLRCVDAAREGALAASRGEEGEPAARRAAPADAAIEVGPQGDVVRVEVRAQVRPLGRYLPGFTVTGTSVAAVEPLR